MSDKIFNEALIDKYAEEIMKETGILKLPQEDRENYKIQIKRDMQKMVVLSVLNSVSEEKKQEFKEILSASKDIKILLDFFDKTPNLESLAVSALDRFKKMYIGAFGNALKS